MTTRKPYAMTLQDLRLYCGLLASIDVTLHSREGTEELVGKNAAGEILIRVKGKVTPAKVREFRDSYQHAVAAGIIKERTN